MIFKIISMLKRLNSTVLAILLIPAFLCSEDIPAQVEVGGQIRARYENTNLTGYGPLQRVPADMLLLRTRAWAKGRPAEGVLGYLQIQDSRISGTEVSVSANAKNTDLHQGYFDIEELWGLPLSARMGRQELVYGDQRLVSPLDWSNVGRAWDGVRLRAESGPWRADVFSTWIVESGPSTKDTVFSGIYASCQGVPKHETDLYFFSQRIGNGTTISEKLIGGNLNQGTSGARIKRDWGGLVYSGEGIFQFGDRAGDRICAWASAETVGLKFFVPWDPFLAIEHTYASGDSDPSDGRQETFDPLFPFQHYYQGHLDVVGWKNSHSGKATVAVSALKGVQFQADFYRFWLDRTRDSWYSASGASTARDATGGSGKHLGSELDVHIKTTVRKALNLWFGYAHFWNGAYAKNTAITKNKDWFFFQTVLNF